MLKIDNLTVVYLTGLVSLFYGVTQALTLRDAQRSSRIWVVAQLFLGFGFTGLVYFGKDPLTKYWIASYALLVLGGLTQLTAIARFGKNPIPKIPAIACLIAVAAVVFLFESTRMLGAPLSSLETFLFAPLAAIYIYTAWFSGKMGDISHSLYLKLISVSFWVYAVLMVLTLLLSLFGLGRGLIDINSIEIGILALASFMLSLVTNYLWSIQAAELSETNINLINFDIALEAKAKAVPVFVASPGRRYRSKQPKKNPIELSAEDQKDAVSRSASAGTSEKAAKIKKLAKAPVAKQSEVNPDNLSIAEQEALIALLTDREREVFMLAADGMRNGQIAQALNSAEPSIRAHRSRMVSKLSIGNSGNLAKLKKNLGLTAAVAAPVAEPVLGVAAEQVAQAFTESNQSNVERLFPENSNPRQGFN